MVGTVIMMRMNQDGLTPQQRVDKIFKKMDQDKDDQITLEEFKEATASHQEQAFSSLTQRFQKMRP